MLLKKKTAINVDELAAITPPRVEVPIEKIGNKQKEGIKGPEDRYYLPVLNINHTPEWESKPNEERKHFTDEVAMDTCLGNCCGVPGLKGGCCHLDPVDLEHVLGPVDEEWIRDTIKWFKKKGIPCNRTDLVIDHEEGKILGETIFKDAPNNQIFQQKEAYPFLRFQVLGPRYVCKFMNPQTYKCQIYEVRPNMCRTYYCQYIVTNFLVKTKQHPNRWQKIR
jgi:Fe-S-cluster containining protein